MRGGGPAAVTEARCSVAGPSPTPSMGNDMPKRIQRKRTKGWRMPANAVSVTRPGRFGNRFQVGHHYRRGAFGSGIGALFIFTEAYAPEPGFTTIQSAAQAVEWFEWFIALPSSEDVRRDLRAERGKDHACWCKLCPAHADGLPLGVVCSDCPPCHGNVTLRVANT